jgi:phosphohistidine phosphatase
MVYLVHHADAVGPDVDTQRPLSTAGRAHADRLAADAAARGVKPLAIWHSGKLRARQTAEAFWRACNPLAEFAAIRGLQPDDPPNEIATLLAGEVRNVMLVGHLPSLPRLLQALLGRREGEPSASFPQHGLVALEADGAKWAERWRIQ